MVILVILLLFQLWLKPLFAIGLPPTASFDTKPSIDQVMPGLQAAFSKGMTPIIRIGVHTDGAGMKDPVNLAKFAMDLDKKIDKDVYLVAGPNEPETELWATPTCSDGDTGCIGPKVATYMNTVLSQSSGLTHIKYLSPVFNLCSYKFPDLVAKMSGANWSGLSAIAVNVYQGAPGNINDCLAQNLPKLPNKNVIITETGVYSGDKPSFYNQIRNLPSNVIGALLFNGLNTNKGWSKYSLSDSEIADLCQGNCRGKKIGVNFATTYTRGDYERAGKLGMNFTLEILGEGGDPAAPKVYVDQNFTPNLSRGLRFGAVNSNSNINPSNFVSCYYKKGSPSCPFPYPATTDSEIEDIAYYNEDSKYGLGYIPNEVSISQSKVKELIRISAMAPRGEDLIDKIIPDSGNAQAVVDGAVPKEYRELFDQTGAGWAFSVNTPLKPLDEVVRDVRDFKSGITSRIMPETLLGDKQAEDWLCKLGASSSGQINLGGNTKQQPVNDILLAHEGNKVESDFTVFLPNGDPDRSPAKSIRASSVYCAKPPSCDGKYGPQKVDFCNGVVKISAQEAEQAWVRLKELAVSPNTASSKIITVDYSKIDERHICEEEGGPAYSIVQAFNAAGGKGKADESPLNVITHDPWDIMKQGQRDYILRNNKGLFYFSSNSDRSCSRGQATIAFAPINTKLAGSACAVYNLGTPQSSHPKPETIPKSLDYENVSYKKVISEPDPQVPLGVENEIKTGELFYNPANKAIQFFASLVRSVYFPKNYGGDCPIQTAQVGEEAVLDGNGDVVGTKPKMVDFPLCQTHREVELKRSTFVSRDILLAANCTINGLSHLIPQSTLSKVQAKAKDEYAGTQIDYKSQTGCQPKSFFDFAVSWLGDKSLTDCAPSMSEESQRKQKTIILGPSTESYKDAANKLLVPQSWQDQGYLGDL